MTTNAVKVRGLNIITATCKTKIRSENGSDFAIRRLLYSLRPALLERLQAQSFRLFDLEESLSISSNNSLACEPPNHEARLDNRRATTRALSHLNIRV